MKIKKGLIVLLIFDDKKIFFFLSICILNLKAVKIFRTDKKMVAKNTLKKETTIG